MFHDDANPVCEDQWLQNAADFPRAHWAQGVTAGSGVRYAHGADLLQHSFAYVCASIPGELVSFNAKTLGSGRALAGNG